MAVGRHPAFCAAFLPGAVQAVPPVVGLDDITPDWAWGDSTGRGVKVAVIDSGIDASHPAIGRVDGHVEVRAGPDGPTFHMEPHEDSFGHGTACAGIIRGLAPECELYSVKVLSKGPSGTGPVFAAGLRWAIEHGMHVCNLSLGTTKRDYYALFHELADLAYFNNVMLVTAANNMPSPSFPSLYSSVVSVASHEIDDPFHYYYNPHPPVEFGATSYHVGTNEMTASENGPAPHRASVYPRPISPRRATTSRLTATRKLCMRWWSIARQRRSWLS